MPGFERFCALAQAVGPAGGVIPVWRDCLLDTDTAVSAFAKLRRGSFAFLLESAPAGSETWSRYTFMGTEPRSAWRLTDGTVEDWTTGLAGWHGARRPPPIRWQTWTPSSAAIPPGGLGESPSRSFGRVLGQRGWVLRVRRRARYLERLPSPPPKRRGRCLTRSFVMTRGLVTIDSFRARARVVVSVPVSASLSSAEIQFTV